MLWVVAAGVGCITVNERVERQDVLLESGQVSKTEQLETAVVVDARLQQDGLLVQLSEQTRCRDRVVRKIQRRDRVTRHLALQSYPVLGCELLGGIGAAGLAGATLFYGDPGQGDWNQRLNYSVLLSALTLGLLGGFTYHVVYLLGGGESSQELQDRRWVARDACTTRPLAQHQVAVQLGKTMFRSQSDAQGRLLIGQGAETTLREQLAGNGWRVQVDIAALGFSSEVLVADPGHPAESNSSTANSTATHQDPATATFGDAPPVPDAPLSGVPEQN